MRLASLLAFLLLSFTLGGCQSTLEDVDPEDVTLYEASNNAGVEWRLAAEAGSRDDAFVVLLPQALAEAKTDDSHHHRTLVLFAGLQRWMSFSTGLPGAAHAGYSDQCLTPASDDLFRVADSCLRSKQLGLQGWAVSILGHFADARSFAMLIDHLAAMHERRDERGARHTLQVIERVGQSNGAAVRSGPKGSNPMELETPWRTIIFGSLTRDATVDWDALGTTVSELRAWLEKKQADLPPQARYGA